MSVARIRRVSPWRYRARRRAGEAACMLLGIVLIVWSLAPIYNMVVIAISSHDGIFAGTIRPESPTLDSFYVVVTEGFWYLERFWHQFGNSFFVGLMTMFLTLLIGSINLWNRVQIGLRAVHPVDAPEAVAA